MGSLIFVFPVELKSASARMLYKANKNSINCYTNGTTVCQEWDEVVVCIDY